jgi:CTP:molybdopterin cytidylyltransferase MocA
MSAAKHTPGLLTRSERAVIRGALAQLLAGESGLSEAQARAAESALDKMNRPDPAQALLRALKAAFNAFAHDDDGPVWADSTIRLARTAIAKATGSAS